MPLISINMVKDSETPQSSERYSSVPPPARVFDKKRLVRLMICENRRKLMSDKILPVSVPFADEKYYEQLQLSAEEEAIKRKQYEALSEQERLKHPELESQEFQDDQKLWELIKDFLETTTNKSIEELRELNLEKTREIDEMATTIENIIAKHIPFLNGDMEKRKNTLRKLSEKADMFYNHYIQYLPETAQSLRWRTTLTNADNNVGQLALKFITSKNPRLRHHSKIKMLLMLHLGFITDNKNKGVGFDESLSFLTNFITRSVAYYSEIDERGCAQTKFLHSIHSDGTKKTDNVSIHEEKKVLMSKDNELWQEIGIRKAVVTNDENEERIVEFAIESRNKDNNSLAEKGLRPNPGKIKDHHGIKFIFETKEDVKDFEKLLIDKLQKEYFETLIFEYNKVKNKQISAEQLFDIYTKRLKEPLKNKREGNDTDENEKAIFKITDKISATQKTIKECLNDQNKIEKMLEEKDRCIKIEYNTEEDMKDENGNVIKNTEGKVLKKSTKTNTHDVKSALKNIPENLDKGQHAGASKGSSKFFKVRKYYVDYRYPDFKSDKIMSFEWQFQLFDGYADSQVRDGVNEDEFHVNRAFDDGLMELLAPPDVYTNIDLKKAKADRLKEIRHRIEDLLINTRKGKKRLIQARKNNRKK